jgi:hypothetical protein
VRTGLSSSPLLPSSDDIDFSPEPVRNEVGTVGGIALSIAALLVLVVNWAPAQAQGRLALVIGNSRYINLPSGRQLPKAVLDARLIGDTLARLGFDVTRGENLDRKNMRTMLDDFTNRLKPGDFAFLYFAGHGASLAGENFLLPVDCPALRPNDQVQMLTVAEREKELVKPRTLDLLTSAYVVIVVDAFHGPVFKNDGPANSLQSPRTATPPGALLIHSAFGRQISLDRLGSGDPDPNSLFARVLAQQLSRRDVFFDEIARDLRITVTSLAAEAGHVQVPYYEDRTQARMSLAGNREARSVLIAQSTSTERPQQFPKFPWPPPHPSALYVIPRGKLISPIATSNPTQGAIIDAIQDALDEAAYYERSFYSAPGGIVMVTRLERFMPDGSPDLERRWIDIKAGQTFSLVNYFNGLLFADPGRFRLVVFIMSDQPFASTGKSLAADEGQRLLSSGFNTPPQAELEETFSIGHKVSVLVYEFEKNRDHDPVQIMPGKLPARAHLEKSKVWAGLQVTPGR